MKYVCERIVTLRLAHYLVSMFLPIVLPIVLVRFFSIASATSILRRRAVETQVELQCILHEPLQLALEYDIVLPRPVGILPRQRHGHELDTVLGDDAQLTPPYDFGGIVTVPFLLEAVPIAQRAQYVHAGVYRTDLVESAHGGMYQVSLGRFVDLYVEREMGLCSLFILGRILIVGLQVLGGDVERAVSLGVYDQVDFVPRSSGGSVGFVVHGTGRVGEELLLLARGGMARVARRTTTAVFGGFLLLLLVARPHTGAAARPRPRMGSVRR
mmetsp:Transcript_36849/g.88885  ORF Transcript_36849/g.88885 Transcript_36849/m.88885 type:complete len:270 (+) Transcript_36849:494-1303(+)